MSALTFTVENANINRIDGITRTLATSGRADVPVWRQIGPNDVRRVGVPCFVGVNIDVAELISRLGEKALKSKGKRATAFHGALVVSVRETASDIIIGDRHD